MSAVAAGPGSPHALIVSGADPGYFAYLQELWNSYNDCGARALAAFGVLDLGLDATQVQWLRERGVELVRPPWPYAGLESQPEWFKAMACRPFLPELFPHHEFVFWIDADSWIQDVRTVELFLAGAGSNGFAVVPAVDRSYRPGYSGGGWFIEWQRACLEAGFGGDVAERLYRYPIISAGAVCGAAGAPHWKLWQAHTRSALERSVYREAEQSALSVMVHEQSWSVHLLPSYCHWLCNMAFPMVDARRGLFVEPYQPHVPIGIMALAANTKDTAFALATTDGSTLTTKLRYASLRGG